MSSVSILFVDFLRTYSRFLTDDEIYYLNTCGNARCLHNIFNKPLCGLALNKPNFSEYRCFLPTKAEPLEYLVSIGQCTYPIHSFECSKCGMHRAINHQVIGSTICSFCVQNKSCVSADPLRCYINECDKCSSYYTSVIRLNHSFQSLCYFCLTGGIPPSVECVSCKYKFIVPNWRDPIYQCLACKMNKGTTNPCIVRNCILKDFISFKDDILNRIVGLSITEIADAINTIDSRIFFTMLQNVTFARMASEANRTYVFAETKEAIAELFSQFGSKCKQTVHTDCFLCCRQLPQCYTIKLCGSQKCSGNYCVTCAYSIQKKVIPGKLVNYSDCCCPFCKNVFNFNPETITYDLPILKLKVPSSAQKDSEVNYMAWCKQCNILKGHSQLRCQEETPVVENWICEDCVNPIKQVVRTVTCSHCKKNVYKVISENGVVSQHCNHLQCWGCGWHVCAFESCGKAFGTSGICYDHMKQVHGGNYDRR